MFDVIHGLLLLRWLYCCYEWPWLAGRNDAAPLFICSLASMRSSDEADKEAKCIPAHKSACIKQQVTQDRIIAGGVQLGADLHLLLKLFWWRYCPTMRDSKRPADILYEPQRHRSG